MVAGIAFVGIAIVQQWWRYNRAKDAAASWLRRHQYRVHGATQYDAVTDVALTPEGQRVLDSSSETR